MASSDDAHANPYVDVGTDITGSAAGAAIGLIAAGPIGAIAGSVMGPAIKAAANEMASRVLSGRERSRVGTALHAIQVATDENLRNGHSIREDGFFDRQPDGRNSADEIMEGVLLAARREHEERKVPYMGYLMANIAFTSEIDDVLANHVLQLAEELSWTQCIVLSLFGRKEEFTIPAVNLHVPGSSGWSAHGLLREVKSLGSGGKSYVSVKKRTFAENGRSVATEFLFDYRLQGFGVLLHDLMWLDRVPAEDITALLKKFDGFAHRDVSRISDT